MLCITLEPGSTLDRHQGDHDKVSNSACGREATTFWDVWQQYQKSMLCRRCRRWMGGNQAEADDALSEACLRAWQGWTDRAQPITNIPGWLSRLVQNHCHNLRTVQARHSRFVQYVEDIATVAAHTTAPGYPSPNSVRLNFCRAVELSDASGQYERSIQLPWPIH